MTPRRLLAGLVALLAAVAVAALATAPRGLNYVATAPEIDADVGGWLAARESEVHARSPIIPGAEKRLRWFGEDVGQRTDYSVVYLHGFSASRQEIAPVGALIADGLGANLFETRLAGHGLEDRPLDGIRAESWLDDAAEALAIGAAVGDRIVLIGTSTGATLALAMSDHASFDRVAAVVLISPNFAPRDGSAEMLTWPGGPQLARLLVGETRSWTAANTLQDRYWSTSYPTAAVVEMMRLVNFTRSKLPMRLRQPMLTLYSPRDQVVDTEWIAAALAKIESPRTQTIEIAASGDPSNHVLAGDILAPRNNRIIADHVVRFVTNSGL